MTKIQERQINLLNQIIEEAEKQDFTFRQQMIAQHKALKCVGEGWMVFHLKALRELLLQSAHLPLSDSDTDS